MRRHATRTRSGPLVSVVLVVPQRGGQHPDAHRATRQRCSPAQAVEYELLFVNDDSTDASLAILLDERERNPRVKIVNMSRRFGVAEGVLAGMAASRGDAVVYMDADLQDPPEVIPALLERWRAGRRRRPHRAHAAPRRERR